MDRKYKAKYTEKFRDEQVKWFEERMDNLPQTLQIDEASSTSNLPQTVRSLIQTISQNKPSIVFSGYLETLLKIKDKLKEGGMK